MSINRQQMAFYTGIIFLVALPTSRFMLSVCMFAFVALAVLNVEGKAWAKFPAVLFNPALKDGLRRFFTNRAYLGLSLVFFIVLLSAAYSTEDNAYLLERLRIKLPFLVLPFAFAGLPPFSKRQLNSLLYVLVLWMSACSLIIGINYLLHFEEFNDAIRVSKAIPTLKMSHIRFSLLLAFTIVVGGWLSYQKFQLRYRWERYVLLGCTLFLLLFIHLLSVRSGLLALYAAVFVLGIRYIYTSRRYWIGLAIVVAMVLLPIVAYNTMTSFRTKVQLTRWSLMQYRQGNIGEYSDTNRLVSYEVGWRVGREQFWFGVGIGDVEVAIMNGYAKYYPDLVNPRLPHNEWLFYFVGTGIIGLLIFCVGFLAPLFYERRYREPLFLAFYVVMLSSFLTENTIENAIGVAFCAFFILFFLNSFRAGEELESPTPSLQS